MFAPKVLDDLRFAGMGLARNGGRTHMFKTDCRKLGFGRGDYTLAARHRGLRGSVHRQRRMVARLRRGFNEFLIVVILLSFVGDLSRGSEPARRSDVGMGCSGARPTLPYRADWYCNLSSGFV